MGYLGMTNFMTKNWFEPVFFRSINQSRPVLNGLVSVPQYLGSVWSGCGCRLPHLGIKNRTEPDLQTLLRAAQLYLQHIWKLHELPRSTLSNQTSQFITKFMHKLYRLLGITILSSTAYHPQSDGQTQCVNQELKQYICIFINE